MKSSYEHNAIWIRRISVIAEVDPRTVKGFLKGLQIRPSSAERIRRAIEKYEKELAERRGQT